MVAADIPGRMEVLRHALESIADGMAVTLSRTARSSVVRHGLDFSTGVLDSQGELVGQGLCMPTHMGGMPAALKAVLDYYGKDRIYPGDVLINNDPYEGGSHLPDIFLFQPVFSNNNLLGYVCAMTHHTDVGGRVAGGNACDSTEIYQEGLRIPPLKLYERGQPNETLFRIIEKAVRVPDVVLADLKASISAIQFGECEYLKLVEEYGVEGLIDEQKKLMDYSEMLTRTAIRSLPDGQWSFTDYIDDDGIDPDPIAIKTTITKNDDSIHLDFTGTSPQCKGAIQPVFATTKAIAYAVTKCVLVAMGYEIPNAAGYFRPVSVYAPEGTFLNPLLPAPVAARALGLFRLTTSIFGAYAQMLPDKIYAAFGGCELGIGLGGYDRSQTPWKPWVLLEFFNQQGLGGSATRDGQDALTAGTHNAANAPAETLETDHPIQVLRYGFVQDSEGAGKHRGGVGMVREYRYLQDDITLQVRSDRMKFAPYGLYGGASPPPTKITLTQGGESRSMPSKFIMTANSGDVISFQWPGGGGWGDPLQRTPDSALRDVVSEKISIERARDVYGVVIDTETLSVDGVDTERLRAELQAATNETNTGPVPLTSDR